ncbi:MAG: hypothetical protein AAGF90_00875 [Pseudomonadota bacterium]
MRNPMNRRAALVCAAGAMLAACARPEPAEAETGRVSVYLDAGIDPALGPAAILIDGIEVGRIDRECGLVATALAGKRRIDVAWSGATATAEVEVAPGALAAYEVRADLRLVPAGTPSEAVGPVCTG